MNRYTQRELLRIFPIIIILSNCKLSGKICDALSVDIWSTLRFDIHVMDNRPKLLAELGERIKKQRNNRALSQEQLAERCNFDRTYISLVERGLRNPSYTNLRRLADGLGVNVSDLVD